MTDVHLYNNISLGGRGGTNPGQLRIHSGGIAWKKQGGGKAVEVDKGDVVAVTWMKIPRTNQLSVQVKDGLYYKFVGFRDQDFATLSEFFQNSCGVMPQEKQLSVSGHNWGEVELNGNVLAFVVGSKQAFEVSLADVSQIQVQGKNDALLEFHVDDTTGATEKDSLMEISFHIPNTNTQFVGDESHPPAQVFRDRITSMADVRPGGEEPVVTFEGIAILTPRGRYSVELHFSFLRLQGQANDFKIQYGSILRLFLLPRSNQPHTFVIVSLDPPIRKGQTLYPHIVMQFDTDSVVESSLTISEDLLNTKYKDKLESSYKGFIHEVFTLILRGLSSAKVTKPGKFRSAHDGYAVKSSLKAEDGILYPLEKSFFFLPKPPTLILHDEINYVEFERHAAGGSNMHYFDLVIKLKSDQEYVFRNIQRNEYHNLFDFISSKNMKIMNLGAAQNTEHIVILHGNDDDAVDPHLERIKNEAGADESDEEDEDFVAEKDDSGSPTDDSEEGSDVSESRGVKERPPKKDVRREAVPKPPLGKKKLKDGEDDGAKKRKPKKKKDPNAPKRALSGFMFFAQLERENIKKNNPGIAFSDIGRVLGEKWKKMSAEEKEPYEARAREDKKRYSDDKRRYQGEASTPKPSQHVDIDSDNEGDSD